MKIHLVWMVVAVVCGLIGTKFQEQRNAIFLSQQGSIAGQTLVDLSKALQDTKRTMGSFPDSIKNLKVEASNPEFSAELLKKVLYFKTKDGFVAFVGIPLVAYIHSGISTTFQ